MRRLTLSAFLGAAIVVFAGCSRSEVETDGSMSSEFSESVPGVMMVKLSPSAIPEDGSDPDFSAFGPCGVTRAFPDAGRFEERHRSAGLNLWYVVEFDESLPLTKASTSLSALPGVDIVEAVPRVKSSDVPFNDPLLGQQWDFSNSSSDPGYAIGSDINLYKAWELTTGSPEVIVAVIDHGVQYDHEDLAGNMWTNKAEISGSPGVDDDGNGFADDFYGYNFATEDNRYPVGTISPGNHGTHVAGTIAAVNGNGLGVCGIAGGDGTPGSGARIMTVQTMQSDDASAFLGAAFAYAADNGAVIANCSWSLPGRDTTPEYLVEAMNYFNSYAGLDGNGEQTGPMKGGLIIFAAGNDAINKEIPAQEDYVMAVAACGADYETAYYSNFGSWVDITAPGGDSRKNTYIMSTVTSGQYNTMQGTSMAAPHVSGVAALVLSRLGGKGMTRDRLFRILTRTASPVLYEYNEDCESLYGSGLLDAYAAVTCTGMNAPLAVTTLSGEAGRGYVDLSWAVPSDGTGDRPFCFNVYMTGGPDGSTSAGVPVKIVRTGDAKGGSTMTARIDGLVSGTAYAFRVESENLYGEKSSMSDEFSISTPANNPPVITPLNGTSLVLKSHENGTLAFDISDADGEAMDYELSGDLSAIAAVRDGDRITLNIDALKVADGKSYEAVLTVSDPHCSVSLPFTYVVGKNHAPSIYQKSVNILVSGIRQTSTVSLSIYFSDEDGEALSFTASSDDSSMIGCKVSGTNLDLNSKDYGSTTVTVTGSDARGESVTMTINVIVRDGSQYMDLYPNPVKDNLFVRTGFDAVEDITVSDTSGKTVFSSKAASMSPFSPFRIDMSGLPAGEYSVLVGSVRKNVMKL